MIKQNITLDNETIGQARNLAQYWDLPPIRHISAVVSRAIERAYIEESSGIKIELIDRFTDEEWHLIHGYLLDYSKLLLDKIDNAVTGKDLIQQDIEMLKSIIGKM